MRRVKRHRGLGFEIRAGLIALGLVALALFQSPESPDSWLARAVILFTAQPLDTRHRDMMALSVTPDGTVWALGKYEVLRFAGGDPEAMNEALNGRMFRAFFKHPQRSFSTLWAVGPDEVWLGSWYGEVFQFADDRWREHAMMNEPIGKRIHHLRPYRGQLYVASGEGLWRLDPAEGSMQREPVPDDDGRGALLITAAQELLYAGDSGLYRLVSLADQWEWLPLWRGETGQINGLAQTRDGRILVSARRGLFVVDREGMLVAQHFSGQRVLTAMSCGEGILASVPGQGLGYVDDGIGYLGTAGLRADHFSDIALTRAGSVWLAGYGSGLRRVELDLLQRATGICGSDRESEAF